MTEFTFRSPDGHEYTVRGNGSVADAAAVLGRAIVAGSVRGGGVAIGPIQPDFVDLVGVDRACGP